MGYVKQCQLVQETVHHENRKLATTSVEGPARSVGNILSNLPLPTAIMKLIFCLKAYTREVTTFPTLGAGKRWLTQFPNTAAL